MFIYLASPYSHADLKVMEERYTRVCKYAAELMAQGHRVFSPIAHSHPIAEFMPDALRTDFEFWMKQDLPILRYANELAVLMLAGWQMSRGIRREIEYAAAVGVPIRYVEAA
jgi:hypothetical protein